MKRKQRKSAAEARATQQEIEYLEAWHGAMTAMLSASEGVGEAVTKLRDARAGGDPVLIAREVQARADASEAFSMSSVTATTILLGRTSWEEMRSRKETLAQGERLHRVTQILAGATGALVLATGGLIWATFAA